MRIGIGLNTVIFSCWVWEDIQTEVNEVTWVSIIGVWSRVGCYVFSDWSITILLLLTQAETIIIDFKLISLYYLASFHCKPAFRNILLLFSHCFQVEDFLHHPDVHETNKFFVRKYLECLRNGATVECVKGIHPLLRKPQCVYSIDFNPDATSNEELSPRKPHETSCCRIQGYMVPWNNKQHSDSFKPCFSTGGSWNLKVTLAFHVESMTFSTYRYIYCYLSIQNGSGT